MDRCKDERTAAKAGDWRAEPFAEVSQIPYCASFSPEQAQTLELGLLPEVMEDKWFIYFDPPHLYFHRSWTGQPVYRVRLGQTGDGVAVEEAVISDAVLVHSDAEYEARLLDFLISALLLGEDRSFPVPAGTREPMPGIYQHHMVGKGYPEATVPAGAASGSAPPANPICRRKQEPWWKFWN